jgi:hypothetical protein
VRYRRINVVFAALLAVALLGWCTTYIDPMNPGKVLIGSVSWGAYFAATSAGVIWIMHSLTQGFLNLTVTLGRCLTERGKQTYATWADTYLSTAKQAAFASALGLLAPVAVWLVENVVGSSGVVVIIAPSYVIVALTGFIVGCAAYWGAAGVVLCRRLTRPGRLRLYPLIPARTPGVEDLSQLMVTCFVVSAIASAVLLFPFMFWTYDLKDSGLDPAFAVALPLVRTLLVSICAVMTLGLGLLPQIWLSLAIKDVRRATMLRTLRKLSRTRQTWQGETDEKTHEMFKLTAESPATTVGSANIVQISAAGAATIAPWLFSVIFR